MSTTPSSHACARHCRSSSSSSSTKPKAHAHAHESNPSTSRQETEDCSHHKHHPSSFYNPKHTLSQFTLTKNDSNDNTSQSQLQQLINTLHTDVHVKLIEDTKTKQTFHSLKQNDVHNLQQSTTYAKDELERVAKMNFDLFNQNNTLQFSCIRLHIENQHNETEITTLRKLIPKMQQQITMFNNNTSTLTNTYETLKQQLQYDVMKCKALSKESGVLIEEKKSLITALLIMIDKIERMKVQLGKCAQKESGIKHQLKELIETFK